RGDAGVAQRLVDPWREGSAVGDHPDLRLPVAAEHLAHHRGQVAVEQRLAQAREVEVVDLPRIDAVEQGAETLQGQVPLLRQPAVAAVRAGKVAAGGDLEL